MNCATCQPLRRGTQSMILFAVCPAPGVVSSLQAVNVKVGLAVSNSKAGNDIPIQAFDYVFMSFSRDAQVAVAGAIKDLTRQKWHSHGISRDH